MSAFRVYRSRFPWDAPLELGSVRARTISDARVEAKRQWPGASLLIDRIRSASSTAYRAFIATKRSKHRTLRNPDTQSRRLARLKGETR